MFFYKKRMSRPKFRPDVYLLEKDNHFVTKVSTTTTDQYPNVVFLRAKVMLTPNHEKKTHEEDILSLKMDFRKYAENLLNENCDYDKNYIFSVDVAEKSVKYGKTSHFHYDIFLKPKKEATLSEHAEKLKVVSDKMDHKLVELFKKYDLRWK